MVAQVIQSEESLVRVQKVRVQNRNGTIFRGQRISDDGEILDTHNGLTVRIQAGGVGVTVAPGQWWRVRGGVTSRTFINHHGFEMTEDQMEVAPGDAALRMPSGAQIVHYLARNPRFEGIGPTTAQKLWETFGDALYGALDESDTTVNGNPNFPRCRN